MFTPPVLRRSLILAAVLGAAACARIDAPPRSVLFFTNRSADLGPDAVSVIDEFAKDARGAPQAPVLVSGYADPTSSPETARQLSQLRAQVVADALVARGVSRSRITVRPRAPTMSDPGVESRRVELSFGR